MPYISTFSTYDATSPKPKVVAPIFLFFQIVLAKPRFLIYCKAPLRPYKKKSCNGAPCPKFGPLPLVLKREWLRFWPFYFIKYTSATQDLKFAGIHSHSLWLIKQHLKWALLSQNRPLCPKKGPYVRKRAPMSEYQNFDNHDIVSCHLPTT